MTSPRCWSACLLALSWFVQRLQGRIATPVAPSFGSATSANANGEKISESGSESESAASAGGSVEGFYERESVSVIACRVARHRRTYGATLSIIVRKSSSVSGTFRKYDHPSRGV